MNNRLYIILVFKIRKLFYSIISFFRKKYWQFCGVTIGDNTYVDSFTVTWPHRLTIGSNCLLESGIYFKIDGVYHSNKAIEIGNNVFVGRNCEFNIKESISIGDYTMIASGCKFVDFDHGKGLFTEIGLQNAEVDPIRIGRDVWLGFNVIILKGVLIGDGAVVAAGSVVKCNIPSNEIWGGIPARKISLRGTHAFDNK